MRVYESLLESLKIGARALLVHFIMVCVAEGGEGHLPWKSGLGLHVRRYHVECTVIMVDSLCSNEAFAIYWQHAQIIVQTLPLIEQLPLYISGAQCVLVSGRGRLE